MSTVQPLDFLPLIVTSPSGAGKTTLVRRLLASQSDLALSVTYTTRAPRPGEEDGRDYHFVDRARFDVMIADGVFAEWAEVHGNRYGTSLTRVEEARRTHRGLVFVIDHQGARQIKARLPDAVGVFIVPPSLAVLEARLRHRATDDEATIRRRLANATGELMHYGLFDHLVVNDDLDAATADLAAIVRAERTRRWRSAALVERVLRGGDVGR